MELLLWLIVGGLVLLYWFDTAQARERAIFLSKKSCRDLHYQFLDGSVIRYRTRTTRRSGGQLCLLRSYRFYFTTDGHRRWQGYIQLTGKQLSFLDLDEPDFTEGREVLNQAHSLILSASYTEDTNALRSRVEKRSDCCH